MNAPHEALSPEDRELQRALERLAEPRVAESPLRARIEAFREKFTASGESTLAVPGPWPTEVRSETPVRYGAPPRLKIALLLFDDVVALDAVGPYEVLGVLGGVDFTFVAKTKGPVRAARGGLGLIADASIDEVDAADILLVPGGPGAEVVQRDAETLDWVRRIHENSTWTCSACTGSLILGAAGILDGRRATTHWASLERLAGYGSVALRQRVVIDDGIVTGAGVSAGIDMGLVMAALLRGEDAAQTVQLHLEYDPKPPFNAGSPATAPAHITEAVMSRLRAVQGRAGVPPVSGR
jgi:transcriptional regulator GlxA family with amidase domain